MNRAGSACRALDTESIRRPADRTRIDRVSPAWLPGWRIHGGERNFQGAPLRQKARRFEPH
jgi:hypothetical protein